jgi:hypothetical protein
MVNPADLYYTVTTSTFANSIRANCLDFDTTFSTPLPRHPISFSQARTHAQKPAIGHHKVTVLTALNMTR